MAVTQISRIQHRRGLEQDLPQLSSAELGWSVDTRHLYIGNGTLEEGAPTVGVTRILTEHDVAALQSSVNNTYTFIGNVAGFEAQTGPSALSPIQRIIQAKLDDIVNVRDFGAVGNGSIDDTVAINRAIQQIYLASLNPTNPLTRRTVYFPAGTYILSGPIFVPPYAHLVGDGITNSILKQQRSNESVLVLSDSSFQTGANLGIGSAVLPLNIEINNIQLYNANTSVTSSLLSVDSASNILVHSVKLTTDAAGVYPNLVSILTSVADSSRITFDKCQFNNAGYAIDASAGSINTIRVLNSSFETISNVAFDINGVDGFVSLGNYYGTSVTPVTDFQDTSYFFGDNLTNDLVAGGIQLGNLQIATSRMLELTTNESVIPLLSNIPAVINYQIKNSSGSARSGTFSFSIINGVTISYEDSYTETDPGVGANLYANTDSLIASVSSGTAEFKFNFNLFR